MCRFLDAGNHVRPARSTSRRPKSAKARSRGKLGTAGAIMISATRVRGDAMSAYRRTEESGGASRRAREVQQQTAAELIDGYIASRGGNLAERFHNFRVLA